MRQWTLALVILAALFSIPASSSPTPTSPEQPAASEQLPDLPQNVTDEITHLAGSPQPTGVGCSPEGQWNCMGNQWQRCASGRWSVIMACAAGTACVPLGLTNDFRIQSTTVVVYTGGGSGSAGAHGKVVDWRGALAMGAFWMAWTSRL